MVQTRPDSLCQIKPKLPLRIACLGGSLPNERHYVNGASTNSNYCEEGLIWGTANIASCPKVITDVSDGASGQ